MSWNGRITSQKNACPLRPCGGLGRFADSIIGSRTTDGNGKSQLVFSIDFLIAYITRVMTLLPGDIVATGTPSGVGPIAPGDNVTIAVAGVGELTNPVAAEAAITSGGGRS